VARSRLVDFLPLARPAAVDFFPLRLRPDLTTILYLASLLLFPREGDVDLAIDYKTHYYANHRAFFILFALFTPVDIVDSVLKGIPHVLQLGPQYRMHSTARMVIFCQPFVCTWTCRKNLPLIYVSFPTRRMTFDLDLKLFEAQSRTARQLTKRCSEPRDSGKCVL